MIAAPPPLVRVRGGIASDDDAGDDDARRDDVGDGGEPLTKGR
jgi:hypothetical protein